MENRIEKYYNGSNGATPDILEEEIVSFVKWGFSEKEEDDNSNIFDDDDEGGISLMQPVVMSPMGPIKMGKLPEMNDVFKFWIGHAKVNLSQDLLEKIQKISGIETLDPITRYRMRIGVGEMFSDEDVLRQVKNTVREFYKAKK